MPVTYDKDGNCTKCGLPGSGFVEDGVCMCLEDFKPYNRNGASAYDPELGEVCTKVSCNHWGCRVLKGDF